MFKFINFLFYHSFGFVPLLILLIIDKYIFVPVIWYEILFILFLIRTYLRFSNEKAITNRELANRIDEYSISIINNQKMQIELIKTIIPK
jgi:hypothetical protein